MSNVASTTIGQSAALLRVDQEFLRTTKVQIRILDKCRGFATSDYDESISPRFLNGRRRVTRPRASGQPVIALMQIAPAA
eukprot:scaffold22375_cov24-Prasinocladus_malaysianus.AAC.1